MDDNVLPAAPPVTPVLTAWNGPPLMSHGFMGRVGGVSQGPFASMNLARWVGDDPAAVNENWRRWHDAYPDLTPAYLNQVHGDRVLTLAGGHDGVRRSADGMVTAMPGIALCIFSADCVPVLLTDRGCEVIGALHAGWRGTLANIAAEGVRAMVALGARPECIDAALGPSIGVCCFEVDLELAGRFAESLPESQRFSRLGRPGKAHLDLRPIIHTQLTAIGLNPDRIAAVGPCTRCANDRYFSRRATQGATTGLQMSFIALER